MALIVENGTGRADAESYASVADADAYHAGRGNAQWSALSIERREQLLRTATEYMGVYAGSLSGRRQVQQQALDWPRTGAEAHDFDVPEGLVPPAVRNACAVLALKAASGPLVPTAGGLVKKRQKLGPLEVEYQDSAATTALHPAVNALLAPFFGGAGDNPFMAPLERS